MRPDWRFAFEVAMGGFIKTPYAPDDSRQKRAFNSYSGKRVDFLLIDRFGNPVLVVEYNGSVTIYPATRTLVWRSSVWPCRRQVSRCSKFPRG
nr:DUF2726 domain-containing protein [Acetobacter lovaniensis]